MSGRRDLGGWLDRATGGASPGNAAPQARGSGTPQPAGQASGVTLLRRVLGIGIDWGFAWLIATGLLRGAHWGQYEPFKPVVVLFVIHAVLVGAAGFTAGHWVAGLAVVAQDGGPVGVLRAVVRSLLLCLLIPPLVWDAEGRGMHDRVATTRLVRRVSAVPPSSGGPAGS